MTCKKKQAILQLWVRFIFLHSSTIVSVADLTHPNLPAHNKLIICKKMKRTLQLSETASSLKNLPQSSQQHAHMAPAWS